MSREADSSELPKEIPATDDKNTITSSGSLNEKEAQKDELTKKINEHLQRYDEDVKMAKLAASVTSKLSSPYPPRKRVAPKRRHTIAAILGLETKEEETPTSNDVSEAPKKKTATTKRRKPKAYRLRQTNEDNDCQIIFERYAMAGITGPLLEIPDSPDPPEVRRNVAILLHAHDELLQRELQKQALHDFQFSATFGLRGFTNLPSSSSIEYNVSTTQENNGNQTSDYDRNRLAMVSAVDAQNPPSGFFPRQI